MVDLFIPKQFQSDNDWFELHIQSFINSDKQNFIREEVVDLMICAFQNGFEMSCKEFNSETIIGDEYKKFILGVYKEYEKNIKKSLHKG